LGRRLEGTAGALDIGPVTYDPGVLRPDGQMGAFRVTARGPHPGCGRLPETVTGTGENETAALRDLDDRLRGREDSGGYLDALRQRVRLARLRAGRGLSSRALRNKHGLHAS
jgi:hypothetical protein